MTESTGKRRVHRRATVSGLTNEQKDFVLRWLSCGFSYTEIAEAFLRTFGKRAPTHQAITGYRTRWRNEIERRRREYEACIKWSGIPYVLKLERVARYSEYVEVADAEGKHLEAAKYLRSIAQEVGDLKQNVDLNDVTNDPMMGFSQ